jgi:hypothetical protein
MIMYKLLPIDIQTNKPAQCVIRSDGACIPFDPANVDFQNFKKEVLAGAELQDDTGNVMTQANEFIGTLP